jgi:hypothetical protein
VERIVTIPGRRLQTLPRLAAAASREGQALAARARRGGGPEDLSERVRETIWEPLPEESRETLLALSSLERLTAPQAARLRSAAGRRLLSELAQRYAFAPPDPVSGTCSVHAVLRKALLGILESGAATPERRAEILLACGNELRPRAAGGRGPLEAGRRLWALPGRAPCAGSPWRPPSGTASWEACFARCLSKRAPPFWWEGRGAFWGREK